MKVLINVMPASALTKLGADQWRRTGEAGDYSFEVYEATSLESARELANKLLNK